MTTQRTDRERFLDLLKDFGVKPQTAESYEKSMGGPPEGQNVHLEEGIGGVGGYTGFLCRWEFDEDGNFKGVSVWE